MVTDRNYSPAEEPTTSKEVRVLIIEDEFQLCTILRKSLGMINVQCYSETTGERGLDAFHDLKPDLVLLDIGLPDMSGWRVLDAIKEARDVAGRPYIVVISAFGDPANRLMGKLQGVSSYLVKPFTPRDVQQLVGSLFDLDIA
jgi:DNA-binding response OmpR family regulator